MSNAPAPLIDFRSTIAPILFGGLFSWCLFGVLCTQLYTYYSTSYHKDRPLIRAIVHTLFFSEVILTGCATYYIYSIIISAWTDISSISRVPWSISLITPGTAFITLLVHLLFAWRIWVYGQTSLLAQSIAGLVVIVTLLQFVSSVAFTILWATRFNLAFEVLRVEPVLKTQTAIWLGGSFSNDVVIAATMVVMLIQTKQNNTAVFSTVQTLNRLIIRSIETGIVTTIVALIELVLYLHPDMSMNSYYATPYFCLAKFYSTMLMANLNGREDLVKTLHPTSLIELNTLASNRGRQAPLVSMTVERTRDPEAFERSETFKK